MQGQMTEQTQSKKRSIPMTLKGIGYRVRLTEANPNLRQGVERNFELGRSHPVRVRLRPGIQVTVDQAGTSFVLSMMEEGQVNQKSVEGERLIPSKACLLGQEADRLMKRRPRSPYTGVGILRADRVYPKLKSTKKAKRG
jgi:hypothetical protein